MGIGAKYSLIKSVNVYKSLQNLVFLVVIVAVKIIRKKHVMVSINLGEYKEQFDVLSIVVAYSVYIF